ncbi:hypothetical protein H6G83_09660 [Anabaena azotica FACHB-119]|uniref:Uncharacterized protein n=2 Tax=Anabaena azotica TaxID=197653 RepID=A0ABR8D118_9NOST|nr:hypothetical protein [Anabaena azotica FACHB-119]
MVALVVVLLTTAILFRSFERAKNASNVRVNEVVLQAATPALDRARAKITALLADPTLPRAVPSDTTLYKTLINKMKAYSLGDETPLIVGYDLDKDTKVENFDTGSLEAQEVMETAWKFPVDTDNDGKFDSYTLYGIYFRNPPYAGTNPTRKRTPIEARTAPLAGKICDASNDTSASLVGGSSWYKVTTGELKKSFFVYAATVPITDISTLDSTIRDNYKVYQGNRGFSALEMQQDRKQLPLTNNAVVYEDDLEITPGPAFRLNGRIFTNGNFFIGKTDENIRLFQVSSRDSCYYDRENGKIIIGGNVGTSSAVKSTDNGDVKIDLFRENNSGDEKTLASTNKSTTNASNQIAYNSQAYAERIDLLVKAQLARSDGNDPQVVKDNIQRRLEKDPALDANKVRKEELEVYFRQRTRRVPFAEVRLGPPGAGIGSFTATTVLQGTDNTTDKSNDKLRPPDPWIYPTDANTGLTLNTDQLPATDPQKVEQTPVTEERLGDRILVGNNLPELRWNSTLERFIGEDAPETITGKNWSASSLTGKSGTPPVRTRTPQAKLLADLGVTARDGYWESSAASIRADVLDVVGGLRVVTGAGVYSPTGSLPTRPSIPNRTVVWSDVMPMAIPDPTDPLNASKQSRGDLVMRATAVYHYIRDPYNPQANDRYQAPIACVSSYYNPTSSATAADGYNPNDSTTLGLSNNGFSYTVPATTSAGVTRGLTLDSNGLFTTTATANDVATASTSDNLQERLKYQANLVFPNGQFVNPLLRQALTKATDKDLTLSEQSAIDSTICALRIADGTLTRNDSVVPHQAIRETAFLDARQIKAIDAATDALGSSLPGIPATPSQLTGKYDLAVEQRQPLEIRATVLDLNLLRTKSITATPATPPNEYLLPNSGIIYATRDDAVPDNSDPASINVSATDYKLDPNRRPNAIVLENGSNLSRENNYRPEEKGLILATDLPVYIKAQRNTSNSQGEFNMHTREEFRTPNTLTSDWSNFYDRTEANRDRNFACRPNDPRLPNCTTGETWRPAAVIADAVTLLSPEFVYGFRNDGDFDLRNNRTDVSNAGDVRSDRFRNGYRDNNYVTSRFFTDSTYSGSTAVDTSVNSSYFNNFVTPIQRRVNFPEYVMEMCFKINIAECGKGDWYVGYDTDNDNAITNAERLTKSSALPATANVGQLVAGTTSRPPKSGYERFPRRVAFRRNSSDELISAAPANAVIDFTRNGSGFVTNLTAAPVPLGIVSSVVSVITSDKVPDARDNSLWFTTTSDTSAALPATNTKRYFNTQRLFYNFPQTDPSRVSLTALRTYQPLLEPILQINAPDDGVLPQDTNNFNTLINFADNLAKNTRWLPIPTASTFNLIIAAGDTPIRVGYPATAASAGSPAIAGRPEYEINGGLHNFPRFLENWNGVDSNITGSFIQFKRSAYATAPYQMLMVDSPTATTSNSTSLFGRDDNSRYKTDSAIGGSAPYYMPPVRKWGFDVALLSQNPDLFAQRFVIPTTDPPDEFYREVSRDDSWVHTLLCAVQEESEKTGFDSGYKIIKVSQDSSGNPVNTDKLTKFALPEDQRPSCPVNPNQVN